MLYEPLDRILGSVTKVRLLRALLGSEHPLSGREAARRSGVSRIAVQSLDELAQLGVLTRVRTSGQHLFSVNRDHMLTEALEHLFEHERRLTADVLALVQETLSLSEEQGSALLFGSSIRGDAGSTSDLDLLIVLRDGSEIDKTQARLHDLIPVLATRYGILLSPVVITLDQARKQYQDKDPFIRNVLEQGRRAAGAYLEDLLHG